MKRPDPILKRAPAATDGDGGGPADHYAAVADDYATYRPHYPRALFDWLAGLVPAHGHAWDCGCGSGQATADLAPHFRRVTATDASAAQIARARPCAGVTYRVAHAEASGLAAGTVDLITVAQALHWFAGARFFAEARRVLAPHGAIAAWSYGVPTLAPAALDAAFRTYYHEVMGPYWPPERRHVEAGYRTLEFPFREVAAPGFALEARWPWRAFTGYVASWSAAARYRKATGRDPVRAFTEICGFATHAPPPGVAIRWPLALRVGYL